MIIRLGISVLLEEQRSLLQNQRIGICSNASGVLPDLTSSVAALLAVADVRALFGPEHGFLGAAAEGAHVTDGAHSSGIPIYSLYGNQIAPTAEQLAGLDALVFDIQDVGCRFYTYVWTLVKIMEVAAAQNVTVIVTDRPNPLGNRIEGPGIEPGFTSLVGLHNVPIRHGLTIGELAQLANAERNIGCRLVVVPCQGWQATTYWSATGLSWVAPSPNMASAETAIVYPGTCLIEGTNLSVGRGTARPFEWLGVPWINAEALAKELNQQPIPGVRWRPTAFQPCSGPHAGTVCFGVQPHVTDLAVFCPVFAGVALVAALLSTDSQGFALSASGSLYADPEQMQRREYQQPLDWAEAHFDRLAGSSQIREQLIAGTSATSIAEQWQANEAAFALRAAPYRLYH
jgi:uncharacterized protein YbbC (DUF1343 family)